MLNPEITQLERVLVIGSSCAGKSTFSRALAEAASLRYVELDPLYWGPSWSAKPAKEFRRLVSAAIAGDRWVADGNYSGARDILWPRATVVIWLNYAFPLVFWRALRRTLARSANGQELWHGNRESFRRSFLSRDSILLWVASTFRSRRHEFEKLRAGDDYRHLVWVELKRPAQAEAFLRRCTSRGIGNS